ncbi:hypothetical protein EQG64_32795 [Streptomyces sp. S6]|nr:hypothetical protein EQG64_32795 [Streptomyces sp. S6]
MTGPAVRPAARRPGTGGPRNFRRALPSDHGAWPRCPGSPVRRRPRAPPRRRRGTARAAR